jgi:hypothetical protein
MNSMAIDRRAFLTGSVLAVTAGTLRFALASEEATDFVSACRRPDGTFAIVLLARSGQILREIPLSARGHDIAIHRPSGQAVAFARRPGFFAVAFDVHGRAEPKLFAPAPQRHFFGHGAFAHDGRLLYVSEHDIETEQGLIGIYDATGGFRRIGEFASHGVGPHEVILLADGRTLAVANGGIATDPASGRENLNLPAMEPSLAFIDAATGALKAKHGLPAELHMLSIRHLAASAAGDVWFGGQWQGSLDTAPELIGRASIDRPITILQPPEPRGVALKGYIGSVAISPDGRFLAASAPRAGRIVYVDTERTTLQAETALDDGCGLAALADDVFALSSGRGVVRLEKPGEAPRSVATVAGTEFDNHLRLIR